MSLVSELSSMNLEDASKAISHALIEKKSILIKKKHDLADDEKKYKDAYILHNDGDASENAPLDEAKKNLRTVAGEILGNLKVLQTLEDLEDVDFLIATFDYTDIKSIIEQLSGNDVMRLAEVFPGLEINNVESYFTSLSIEDVAARCERFLSWVASNNVNGVYNILISKIEELYEVASMPQYNTCGIVKMYSTVRLKCSQGTDESIMTYKIYPAGLSFLDIGIIAADCRVAQAILEKEVGNKVDIKHASKDMNVVYEILEIY